MKTLEISELSAELMDALRLVEDGETIDVVREGHVIARFVPVQQPDEKARKNSLLTKLQEIHIDAPEDFSSNLDTYLNGEKQFE